MHKVCTTLKLTKQNLAAISVYKNYTFNKVNMYTVNHKKVAVH